MDFVVCYLVDVLVVVVAFLSPRARYSAGNRWVIGQLRLSIRLISFTMTSWNVNFLQGNKRGNLGHALIILNQPFSAALFHRVWLSCEWRCCADGGANRLYDLFEGDELRLQSADSWSITFELH